MSRRVRAKAVQAVCLWLAAVVSTAGLPCAQGNSGTSFSRRRADSTRAPMPEPRECEESAEFEAEEGGEHALCAPAPTNSGVAGLAWLACPRHAGAFAAGVVLAVNHRLRN